MIIIIILIFLTVLFLMFFWGQKLKMPLLLFAVFLSAAIPYSLQKEYYLFSWNDLHFNLADFFFVLNIINFAINIAFRRAKVVWNKYTQIFYIFLLYFLTIPVFYSLAKDDIFWLVRNLRVFLYLLYVPIFIDATRTEKNVKLIFYSFMGGILFSLGLFYLHVLGFIFIPGGVDFELGYENRGRIFFISQFLPVIGFLVAIGLWNGKFAHKCWQWLAGIIIALIALFLVGGRADWISALVGLIIISWFALKLRGLFVSKKGLRLTLRSFCLSIFVFILLISIGTFLGKDFIGYIEQLLESIINPSSPSYYSIPTRINHYLAWLEYSLFSVINLIIGHGLGTTLPLDLYYKYNLETYQSAGNQWMDILGRGGLIGLILFVWFQFEIFKLLLFIVKNIKEHSYFLLGVAILGIWAASLLYYTIGHPILLWQCYGVTLGWIMGVIMFLYRQVILSINEEE